MKPMHSGIYIHFYAYHSLHVKGVSTSMFLRLCDPLEREIDFLRRSFSKLGFPHHVPDIKLSSHKETSSVCPTLRSSLSVALFTLSATGLSFTWWTVSVATWYSLALPLLRRWASMLFPRFSVEGKPEMTQPSDGWRLTAVRNDEKRGPFTSPWGGV